MTVVAAYSDLAIKSQDDNNDFKMFKQNYPRYSQGINKFNIGLKDLLLKSLLD